MTDKELLERFKSLLQARDYEQAIKLKQELLDKGIIKVKSSYDYNED